MDIKTKAMGTVSIVERQIIEIPAGFYGFEKYKRFALIDATQKPFIWIQSLDDEGLAFLAIDPFLFRPDYEIDVDDAALAEIGVSSPSDVLVFALITVPQDGGPITANLQGPLIVNKANNMAVQAVLSDAKWGTKHDLLAEFSAKGGTRC
ncbi:MAG TPA: flagellar assembly protein FliW [Treponemataceae bacterium]|jgi:flagellar assembly factor FliW|nr:flagellar assembly protein FliW [Treponemataceae bacterium]